MPSKGYDKVVTVAAVNWKGEWGNKKANLDKIKAKVIEATQTGADMICFPELALSGYECGAEARNDKKSCLMHTQTAETIPGPATEEIAKLAKQRGIYILFGMPEKDKSDPNTHYNSMAILGPEGLVGKFRKIHSSDPPAWSNVCCCAQGNELPVFETRYGPIGVPICADFMIYPEVCRILSFKGARIIFDPSARSNALGKINMQIHVSLARAMDDYVYVVVSNHVGKESTASYCGHSLIAGPAISRHGGKIFAQSGDEEEIIYATLSLDALDFVRSNQVKEKENLRLFAKEYNQLVDSWH